MSKLTLLMLISTAWQIANSANLLNLPVPPIPDVSGVGSALEVPLVKDTGVLNLVVGAAPQTLSCGSTIAYNDSLLGYFPQDFKYCGGLLGCYRAVLCCAPMPPQNAISKLLLWKSATGNTTSVELNWSDQSQASLLTADKCTKVVFVIHGFLESLKFSGWMSEARNGWLKQGPNYCVITVDWSSGNQVNYSREELYFPTPTSKNASRICLLSF